MFRDGFKPFGALGIVSPTVPAATIPVKLTFVRVQTVIGVLLLLASTAHAADFDHEEAKRALEKVHVKHCGYGGPGVVRVTFEPTGFVSNVEVYDGRYTDNAIRCIERLFRASTVLSFDGQAQTVKWPIVLPLEKAAVAAPRPVVVPRFVHIDTKKWRSGDPVPRGYRVEETPRYALGVWGGVLTVLGAALIMVGVRPTQSMGSGSGFTALGGGVLAIGGVTMMVFGFGSSRSELVPILF